VHLRQLRIENLRRVARLELDLSPGWNVFTGPNGAGKTTLLEAAYLLSHARSFRTGLRAALTGPVADSFAIFGEFEAPGRRPWRLGITRAPSGHEARVDGRATTLIELLEHGAVICFEPGSHALIAGPAEERRQFIDWGLFHVEPDFLGAWRAYRRTLRQRNALLRAGADDRDLDVWDDRLVAAALPLEAFREIYLRRLEPLLVRQARRFIPELGAVVLRHARGWREGSDLAEVLAGGRDRDRQRGATQAGPHRADWSLAFEAAPLREHLSRGQEKLCALAGLWAQAELHAQRDGSWPILCLDDPAAELDDAHLGEVVAALEAVEAQVLVATTRVPPVLAALSKPSRRFHVEQGEVSAAD
jgi:DNA replication and repair protein RecF